LELSLVLDLLEIEYVDLDFGDHAWVELLELDSFINPVFDISGYQNVEHEPLFE